MKSSQRMMGCHPCDKDRRHQHKSKDVYAELTCARQEAEQAEHVLALKQRINSLRDRLEALENQAREEKIKQNKLVLRDLVKEARTKIFEVNGIPAPSSKQTWKYSLHNLTVQQLQQANVNVKLWPEIVEILSPSTAKLNNWVHGYTTWQAARVIQAMDPAMQPTWAELFKMTHSGQSFHDFADLQEPSFEPLQNHD